MAQLDFGKKELWAAMEDALEYWVTEVGIDGYRCDYAHGVRDDFWKEAIGKLKALKPGFIMLAESDFTRMFDDGFDIIFDRKMKSGNDIESATRFVEYSDMANVRLCLEKTVKADMVLEASALI